MKYSTKSEVQTIEFGRRLGVLLDAGCVIALQGVLAAGKTQLAKGIARGLGIDEPVTSPTFTLISEYYGRLPLYHMDMYRIGSTEEFLDLGVEDLLYGNGVCVIEWSEKVVEELPPQSIVILLEVQDDGARKITLTNMPYDTASLKEFELA